jgi:hypothetical protein
MQDRIPQCLINPSRPCNRFCLLRENAERYTETIARQKELSFKEAADFISSYNHIQEEIYRTANQIWIEALEDEGYDSHCFWDEEN